MHLRLSRCGISDVSSLARFTELQSLYLAGNAVTDLTPLSGLTALQRLALGDNSISDLTPLAGLEQLRFLDLNRNSISDLTPLTGLASLQHLSLADNAIRDISPLASLSGLWSLSVAENSISDLSPLAGLMELQALYAGGNEIAELEPLRGMQYLGRLDLSDNVIANLMPLVDLRGLTRLNLSGNPSSEITSLAGLHNLTHLELANADLSDIGPLAGLTALLELDLSGNSIVDVAPLSGLAGLTRLLLAENAIADVSSLAGLSRLAYLNLGDNEISDVAPLVSNRGLGLGDTLYLAGNPLSQDSRTMHVPVLEARGIAFSSEPQQVVIDFPDPFLHRRLRIELGPLFGYPITSAHMERVTELNLNFAAIKDLTGLEYAGSLEILSVDENLVEDLSPLAGLRNLTRLGLEDNSVSDLTPLAGLTQLQRLGLAGNAVSDLSPLAGLSSMENLILSDNSISDLSPLSGMNKLRVLYLIRNRVEDLSPLSGLAGLEILNLFDNEISDISPLRDLTGIVELNMEYNAISDLAPLERLTDLQDLGLGVNAISDIAALSNLTRLWNLRLYDNAIADMSPMSNLAALQSLNLSGNAIQRVPDLSRLTRLVRLMLSDNSISDPAPLARLASIGELYLGGNAIVDMEQLLSATELGPGDAVDLSGNPLNRASREVHVPALRNRGVGVTLASLSIEDAFAKEGEALEFTVRLSAPVEEPVRVRWQAAGISANESVDFRSGQEGTIEIAAGETSSTLSVPTLADDEEEMPESVRVHLSDAATEFPEGVKNWFERIQTVSGLASAFGTISDKAVKARVTPFFPTPGYENGQGFARVVNHGADSGEIQIDAFDDAGRHRGTATLAVGAGQAVHFNSDDLKTGSGDKGLDGAVAAGIGAWRLQLRSSLDFEVLSYVRTRDGFLTGMHDIVPSNQDGYLVPVFNPASNRNQSSRLRVVNVASRPADVSITGIDDDGESPGDVVKVSIPSGAARLLTAAQLENGDSGLQGALGDGKGKWRLLVNSEQPVVVMNLLESPTGHLTNLSTRFVRQ